MQICFLQKKVKYLYIAKLIGGKRVVAHGNVQKQGFCPCSLNWICSWDYNYRTAMSIATWPFRFYTSDWIPNIQ